MIDPSRQYILDLYAFFKKQPRAFDEWIEKSPTRTRFLNSLSSRTNLDDPLPAMQFVYSLFYDSRTAEPVQIKNRLNDLLRDIKELESTCIMCEFVINKVAYHYFLIQKTAASNIYIYQSHHPFYTIQDCLNEKNRQPIVYEELSSQLTLLGGTVSNQETVARIAKSLFHIPITPPALYPATFNYIKCPYRPFERFVEPARSVERPHSFLRFSLALTLCLIIYFTLKYFKQPSEYVLVIKYDPPK